MERKVTISPVKTPEHRNLPVDKDRKIVIYHNGNYWQYDFTGRWNAHLLAKVAKGLKRGLVRSRRKGMDKKTLRTRAKVETMQIPQERPGENLGTNPRVASMDPELSRAQPEMPLHAGLTVPAHAPIVEPDAASMQPHVVLTKEEGEKENARA